MKRGIVIESHASRGEKGEGRMRKLMKSFQKRQSIASRVLCFLLVLAMVVTMVPALGGGNSTVQAAEKEKNLTIHFMMPSNWGWTTPAIQFWGGIANSDGKYEYGKCGRYRDTGLGWSQSLFHDTGR